MFHESLWILLKVLLTHRSSYRFIVSVVISFAFSIAVILGTVGLMDGFDYALKKALKRSSGDLIIYSQDGFFRYENYLKGVLEDQAILEVAPIVQTEGFLIYENSSKGVVIKGVQKESFEEVTKLPVRLSGNEMAIGLNLAHMLGVKVGDELTLAFANGDKGQALLPLLKTFRVKTIVEHGIYRKDIRYIYVDQSYLQEILSLSGYVNLISLNILRNAGEDEVSPAVLQRIERAQDRLQNQIGLSFRIRPFWQEFSSLIEAVKIQKFVIALIFQLIVIISIFNLMAFIIYLNIKRAQEIFLFEALGFSRKELWMSWTVMSFILWGASCGLAYVFIQFLSYALSNFSFLKLPGDIYNLSHFSLKLTPLNYLWVDGLALLWVLCMMAFVVMRFRRRPILEGLRKEFS